ncbi:MAG: C39 family peptidase [Clostridiales bacterium]|nr:C39 family peptidase [Clostridiales bacterium]
MKKKAVLAASSAIIFIAAAVVLSATIGDENLAAIDNGAEPTRQAPLALAEATNANGAVGESADEPQTPAGNSATGAELEILAGAIEIEGFDASDDEPQPDISELREPTQPDVSDPEPQTGASEPVAEKSYKSQNSLALAGNTVEPDTILDFEVRDSVTGLMLEPSVTVFSSKAKPALAYEKGSFAEAAAFARTQPASVILWAKSGSVIWENADPLPEERTMKVEKISQLPELPRGCEVTSLAMLLSARGIVADKLELAEKIAKDETPLEVKGDEIYFGDPYKGFVGSMYDLDKDGYGVYHKPIYDLLAEYEPDSAIDLTGCEFEDVLRVVAAGCPVWVVTNSWYQELPESQFETWQVPGGELRATYREHSVLVTGFDSQRIFFNDPLLQAESALREDFTKAWIQMGRQAVTAA